MSLGTHDCLLYCLLQSNLSLFILLLNFLQLWMLETPWGWLLLTCTPPFLNTSIFSDTAQCSGLISCIFCPTSEINYVYKEYRFFSLENGMRNKDLGYGNVYYYWDIIDSKLHQCFYWHPAVLINVVLYWVLKLCSVSVPTLFFSNFFDYSSSFSLICKDLQNNLLGFSLGWHRSIWSELTFLIISSLLYPYFFFFSDPYFFTFLTSIQDSGQCMETYLR